ncbi:MAG TPA: carbonic anhydrase [Acidimicrobiales bacterium]|nr:carbonic anhydrase [Acidimicrobiales bacterium]
MLEELLDANHRYAAGFSLAGLPARTAKGVAIVTCMDTRLEPLAMLGLVPGEAKILRNAGARVTDDVLRSLALATHFLGVEEVAVLQHTGCALAHERDAVVAERLAADGVVSPETVEWLAMPDPDEALRADVERLRSSDLLPPATRVEGWRYDVDDGRVVRVIAA